MSAILSELRKCDQCQPFEPNDFEGDSDWLEFRCPTCDCEWHRTWHGRGYPNGDTSEIDGSDRRSDVVGPSPEFVLSLWKDTRRLVLSLFLHHCMTCPRLDAAASSAGMDETSMRRALEGIWNMSSPSSVSQQEQGAAGTGESKPRLRFSVGDEVMCRFEGGWKSGRIVKLWWRGRGWEAGQEVPYQVELDDAPAGAERVYVPEDTDEFCRRARPLAPTPTEGKAHAAQAGKSVERAQGVPNETRAGVEEEHSQMLTEGAICLVRGLKSASKHNGKTGKLLAFDQERQRWGLKLYDGSGLSIKAHNLKVVPKRRHAVIVKDCGHRCEFAGLNLTRQIAKRVGGCSNVKFLDLEKILATGDVGAVIFPDYIQDDPQTAGALSSESAAALALKRFVEAGGTLIFMADGYTTGEATGASIFEHTFGRTWRIGSCFRATFHAGPAASEFLSKQYRPESLSVKGALLKEVAPEERLYICEAGVGQATHSLVPQMQQDVTETHASAAAARIGDGLLAYFVDTKSEKCTIEMVTELVARSGCNAFGCDPLPPKPTRERLVSHGNLRYDFGDGYGLESDVERDIYGFTEDERNELLSCGVRPWDPDAHHILRMSRAGSNFYDLQDEYE